MPERIVTWSELRLPDGISVAREPAIDADEFRAIIVRSGLRRPTDDVDRLTRMIAGADLLVTARDPSGQLVGVARSLTDFAYCCYLSDLCVDPTWQQRGIGRALLAETRRIIGQESMLLLISAPDAVGYYERLGMQAAVRCFIIPRAC